MARSGGDASARTVKLHGLDPAQTYTLTDVRTGASLGTRTGAQLDQGLRITLPEGAAGVSEALVTVFSLRWR